LILSAKGFSHAYLHMLLLISYLAVNARKALS